MQNNANSIAGWTAALALLVATCAMGIAVANGVLLRSDLNSLDDRLGRLEAMPHVHDFHAEATP